MIRYDPNADIAKDEAQLLVNTVNTVGVMGAGVAKAVRLRYPDIMPPYKAACTHPDPRRRLEPGTLHLYTAPDGRLVVNMATKKDWRDPSEYDWVGAGLVYLNRLLCEKRPDIRSVLLPPPGCGHGGLDWGTVNRMARTYLRPASERGVEIRISAEEPKPRTGPIRFAGVGARATPEPVLALMREVGSLLSDEGWTLRTGEAVGADSAFREGAETVGRPGEIFTIKPRPDIAGSVFDLRPVHLRMLNSVHPKPEALSETGRKLMARNGSQVFGTDFREPSDLVICWTVGGKGGGGTGQAIRLARSVGIPVLDLGRPDLQGVTAAEVVDLSRELVSAHRAACGVPLPLPTPVPEVPDGP
jgi:O-acetyl-ADP-ribose deacetylase (regulator of RNase III)